MLLEWCNSDDSFAKSDICAGCVSCFVFFFSQPFALLKMFGFLFIISAFLSIAS